MAPALRPGQLIIDTCSVKERPLEWMLEELPDHVQIVGTHPLFGPDSGQERHQRFQDRALPGKGRG
jgi:prephenate dehydrogenase